MFLKITYTLMKQLVIQMLRRYRYSIMPSDQFRVTFMIDYDNKTLGTQFTTLDEVEKNFAKEIAPARTFCFLSEIEHLKEEGLIKGGTLDGAVVIVDKEIDDKEAENLKSFLE
ncbi:MAG: hypothetical protein Ct9H90mP7_2560 [Candidatus Neomarinimicrobiota bacterium]|nr:MAG: hypothetical protein Ct9H90mP7_2560 [Candidatus Neomarinimicrobiota bacterium]